MACFVAPAAAAIITSNLGKKISKKYHLEWLNTMLWGGVVMLIVEHFIHGEVVLYPPFFTALKNYSDMMVMFQEIATTGVIMTLVIFLVWLGMVLIANVFAKMREKKTLVIKN